MFKMFESKNEKIKRQGLQIDSLKGSLQDSERALIRANDNKVDAEIALESNVASHRSEIANLTTRHESAYYLLENKLEKALAEQSMEIKKGLAKGERLLASREDELEKRYHDKNRRLESEHAEKIAKMDKKLEEDKASYRKYLRQEFNTRIEGLEKSNKSLTVEAAELRGANEVLESSRTFFTGKQEAMSEITKAVIAALPTVTAEITTPEISVVSGAPAQSKQNNEQKKN